MDEPQSASADHGTIASQVRRIPIALIGLVVLLLAFLGREVMVAWPHTPRVIVENQLPDAIDSLTVEDSSRRIDFGRVPSNGRVVLAIEFRPGELYLINHFKISGDEVINQLAIARQERRDVHIKFWQNGEGFRYVAVEGSTNFN